MPSIVLRRFGCLVVLSAAMAASVVVIGAGGGMVASLRAAADGPELLPRLLVAVATCTVGLAACALCIGGVSVVAAEARGGTAAAGRLSTPLVPCWWRRAVVACCGLGVVAVPGVATAASPSPAGSTSGCPPSCAASLDGLPLPDLPVAREGRAVVVRPGDTLWELAERHLRPGASDAQVLELVVRIHRINRARIGPDPDLIFPGTHLTVPGGNS
jgi:hypothetical protein